MAKTEPTPGNPAPAGQIVKSLLKGIDILNCFSAAQPLLSLAEISATLGRPKSSTLNLIKTLEVAGLVSFDPSSGQYQLSFKMMEYAYNVRMNLRVIQYAIPFLEEIQHLTGENVYLTTHVNGRVFYLECLYPSVRTQSYSVQGKTLPMHCTGVGKAMLAFLPENEIEAVVKVHGLPQFTPYTLTNPNDLKKELEVTRERGFALDKEEETLGVKCVAVPIRDKKGYPVGAISVSGTVVSIPDSVITEYSQTLSRIATGLNEMAPYFPYRKVRSA